MRQPTKGPVLKERVWCFVEALLTRAEDSPDFEIHWETDKDTGRPNFVVKTKRRFLESLAQLKQHELYEVIESLEKLQIWDDRRLKQGKGSEIGSFALKLWSTDVQRNREQFERVWEDSRTAKSKALEATYNKSKDSAEASQPEIDWRNICRTMLEKRKQLTTNQLMRVDEMLFDIDRICVDLALVERKQTDKRSEDDNPARSHSYKPDYEETQKLEYKDFLTKVLKSEQGKKVAIIGEPGAGKTTLLQRIAFWILENTDDLPIWIPLGNFPNSAPNFKDYLLNNWLEDAIFSVTPKIKAEFEERLMVGKVWLLLDGVDEMAAKSGSPLTVIANRIVGWCARLRVVLTCRLNVWEANPYSLNGFQTYRTLEFSEEKVEEFINACFQKSDAELGIGLQQALNQPGKERIKDLVRNPLRLMLLCSTWHLRDGKLPDTKAELYQQYVEEVYRWKKDEFPTEPEEREQLNAKLKELALATIDKEENRFCLRHKFVEGVFRDSSLFQLALDVGWLNQVGVDATNPHQPVYAFFHPTFQEYFAALAIDDWDFFLPRAHDNRNPKPVSERYRIFESQWKEVILLWLGREEVVKEEKERFIRAIATFEDGCKDFYYYRAYFMAAAGIAEFENFTRSDAIVSRIIRWSFGYFHLEKQKWISFVTPISKAAKTVLKETIRTQAVAALVEFIANCKFENILVEATGILAGIRNGNPTDIERIFKDNFMSVEALVELIGSSHDEDTCRQAATRLGEIGKGNSTAINALIQLIQNSQDEYTRLVALETLGEIDPDPPTAVSILVESTQNLELDEEDTAPNLESLWEIYKGNPIAVAALVKLIEDSHNENTLQYAAYSLGIIGEGNSKAISALVELIRNSHDENTLQQAAKSLGKIDRGNSSAIATLTELIENSQNDSTRLQAISSLARIDESNPKAISALVQLLENSQDNDTLREAIWILGKIGKGNLTAITTLVELTQNSQNLSTLGHAVWILGEIGKGNLTAITGLVKLTQNFQDEVFAECILDEVIRSLGKVGKSNHIAITTLIELIGNLESKSARGRALCRIAVDSLKEILAEAQMAAVVTILKDYLDENDSWRFQNYYEVIWHCAQNMTYPAFYQAWHQQEEVDNTTTPNTQSLNQANLPQSLQSAIANDSQLSQTIHLICIDSSQFIDPDRPAAEIYDQMLDQNCPECHPVPETMPALKLYWNSLKRKSDKRPVLVFYASSTEPYNESFLTVLSKFGGAVCVITEQLFDLIRLKFFVPSQAIADVVEWIRVITHSTRCCA